MPRKDANNHSLTHSLDPVPFFNLAQLRRMKFQALLLITAAACISAFKPMPPSRAMVRKTPAATLAAAPKFELEKALPALAALSVAMPAHAEGMTAAFLPPIMVPLVGLVFPGLSMALFFIYSQKEE